MTKNVNEGIFFVLYIECQQCLLLNTIIAAISGLESTHIRRSYLRRIHQRYPDNTR